MDCLWVWSGGFFVCVSGFRRVVPERFQLSSVLRVFNVLRHAIEGSKSAEGESFSYVSYVRLKSEVPALTCPA